MSCAPHPHAGRSVAAKWLVAGAVLALVAATIAGGSALAFLCDDAYIHFRYVANARAGHGLVWNAPPFQPVEGMGFLWTLLLWAVWSCFGVEPPDAANALSLVLGVSQLAVVGAAARRLTRGDGAAASPVVALAVLAVVGGNRTFLQWLSGGLDTALFNLPYVAWVLHAFRRPEGRGPAWWPIWSGCAALAALTRPDGLLAVAATLAVAAWTAARERGQRRRALAGLTPLLAVAAHVAWRRAFYGEWLPNTYYAKVNAPWPDAGLRWFGCFALENGAWLWPMVAASWLVVELRRRRAAAFAILARHLPAVAAVAVALGHAGYYVLRVGGDHFEYRMLSPLVPLAALGCVAMAARMRAGAALPLATAAALALGGSFGWLQCALTSDLSRYGLQALTPQVPAALRPVTRWFDQQQMWLFCRFVGMRCRFHACNLHQWVTVHYPERLRVVDPPDPVPLMAAGAVGYLGWQLRECAVIDLLGLNDWVIARSPVRSDDPTAYRARLRAAVPAADEDRDGRLDVVELQRALAQALADDATAGPAAFLLDVLVSIHARERPDAVDFDAAVVIGETLRAERLMAHEHQPPPGYVEALDPNVTIEQGRVVMRARTTPMTAEKVRAIEAEWRDRVRSGRLR